MGLPGWEPNPALSRSESAPVRRRGGPENGVLTFLPSEKLKAPLRGSLDQLVSLPFGRRN